MDIRALLCSEDRSAVESYVRSQCRVVPAGGDRVIARVLDSFLLYLDMRDTSIAPHLAMDGYWEMWATIAVARYVKPGMKCIDIGASFGYYTMLLETLVGKEGYVQAWEPLPEAIMCLGRSLSVNGISDERLMGCAASDRTDTRRLHTPGSRMGSSRLGDTVDHPGSPAGHEPYGVACRTVDNITGVWPDLDFVKIDAEGHEAQVWAGMRKTLEASPNLQVMLEFTPEEHDDPERFLAQVAGDGFSVRTIVDNGDLAPVSRPELLETGVKLLWLSR